MSSRMLRKLHGPDRIEAGEADEDNSELDLGRGARPKRPGFNPFDSVRKLKLRSKLGHSIVSSLADYSFNFVTTLVPNPR